MRKTHLIAPVVAAVAFAWVIAHVGLPTMMEQVKAMRVALPIVLALSLLRLFLQTPTWSASLKGEDVSVGMTKLMGVRLASQSMGYLTVLGPVISEPMKIKLLGTSSEPTITATFLDDGVYWFTSALLAIAGIVSLPLVAVHGRAYHSIPAVLVLAFAVVIIRRHTPILSDVMRALGTRPHLGSLVPRSLKHPSESIASISPHWFAGCFGSTWLVRYCWLPKSSWFCGRSTYRSISLRFLPSKG